MHELPQAEMVAEVAEAEVEPRPEDIKRELHRELKLTDDQIVTKYIPLIRIHENRGGLRIPGGALVVRCEAEGIGIDGRMVDKVEIDDNHRPLPEEMITYLGAEALHNQAQGRFLTRIVLA